MTKYILGFVVIIAVAVGGYYAYMTYGGDTGERQTEGPSSDETVQAQDVTIGTGAVAAAGSVVSLLYVGRFEDGTVFDSSEAHGNDPLTFQLGTPGIIAGFQIGVNGMREGGERVIAIPPSFGYGAEDIKDAEGKVVIPGNSTLIFNIQLEKVEPPPADSAVPATE